jgi:hypothetical protein
MVTGGVDTDFFIAADKQTLLFSEMTGCRLTNCILKESKK